MLTGQDILHELYDKGKYSDLKEYKETKGKQIVLDFYPSQRVDGMQRREIIVGRKVIETFNNRDDFLVYRSATFDPTSKDETTKIFDGVTHTPLKKMTQKYEKNPSLPGDSCLARIAFLLDQRKIDVNFHRDEGHISNSTRLYSKEGKTKGYQADPLSKKPTPQELFEDFQKYDVKVK